MKPSLAFRVLQLDCVARRFGDPDDALTPLPSAHLDAAPGEVGLSVAKTGTSWKD
jgi:hypothetical protein